VVNTNSLFPSIAIVIVEGSFTTRPNSCPRLTANGLKSIIRNLNSVNRVGSIGNACRMRFPTTSADLNPWKARVFKGPQYFHGISVATPLKKKILVEMIKCRSGRDMERNSSRSSGSVVHAACRACIVGHGLAFMGWTKIPALLVAGIGNKKHDSNCGACDTSSIE
jgi:hypothetical protein